jgi:hypothetical protein
MYAKVTLFCALALALAVSTQACGGNGPQPERSAEPLVEEDAGSDPPADPTPAVDPDTQEGQTATGGGEGLTGGGSADPSVGAPVLSSHDPKKQ